MTNLIIWGATGQAIVLEELISHSDVRLLAVFDNNADLQSPLPDVPLYIGEAGFKEWRSANVGRPVQFAVAIGGEHGVARMDRHLYLLRHGLTPRRLIHHSSFVAANAHLGEGCQVLANATVCARAILGTQVIVNSGANIDHECRLGDGVHIGPGATLAGAVLVDDYAFVGAGATVLPRVTIGAHSIVGAGSVVTSDVPNNTVVVGVPAKAVRSGN